MRVALGSDHAGFDLKERLKRFLDGLNVPYEDVGCSSPEPVDYPDIAAVVARRVAGHTAERGILICGTGIGMAVAANKVGGIRAAAACSRDAIALGRSHNDLNILALGARTTSEDIALDIVRTFLDTPFDGAARHQRRLNKIAALESEVRHPTSGLRIQDSERRTSD